MNLLVSGLLEENLVYFTVQIKNAVIRQRNRCISVLAFTLPFKFPSHKLLIETAESVLSMCLCIIAQTSFGGTEEMMVLTFS